MRLNPDELDRLNSYMPEAAAELFELRGKVYALEHDAHRVEHFQRALERIAINDDADCAHANDPKAMIRIAREALQYKGAALGLREATGRTRMGSDSEQADPTLSDTPSNVARPQNDSSAK